MGFINPLLYSLAQQVPLYTAIHPMVGQASGSWASPTGLGSPHIWSIARDVTLPGNFAFQAEASRNTISSPAYVVSCGAWPCWGGYGASPYRPRACYQGIAEFSVYTAREARGTGAGKMALTELAHHCEQAGFWKLVSRIFPENEASRQLCRALGFREVGVYHRHARLDGQWRDVIIVEKLLAEPSFVI